ncbi:class I SAM-dependent methyltransferase [Phormidium sp. FACHB-1136]|uniref:class I SAM-dependent methyltransferase n=1 Tax=Phormidium sp. FACHB-1136 TaxID=2692848 RepID=UPI001686F3F5|nr:class I SAM-dependent methyltransferase [Phormidium sp. FACHB-1136]MBD2426807.1 methyltransferase domain-containing protein [Phormidium sp. FACHB-1136]
MPDTITKLAYQTFQQGKSYFGVTHKSLSGQLMRAFNPPKVKIQDVDFKTLQILQQRLNDLLEQDWADAEAGVYPKELLFDNPWDEFFRFYPFVCLDLPGLWERANRRHYHSFDADIDTSGYPKYYLQNFHHQTNGYLSEMSANLYDLQVEILFNGSADPMRRRILAPLKAALADKPKPKVLDIACGTGRTLSMIRDTLPQTLLYGVDLSPAYLRKANGLLSSKPRVLPQLVQANGEDLPFVAAYFEAVVSVFLFHELPAEARQNVINEAYRVVKPGGVFIICDSIQRSDSPEFEVMMDNFPTMFHEPYYRHYTTDDLNQRLIDAGFESVSNQVHFMSKYWVAHKPAT